jgi:amino acid transporter
MITQKLKPSFDILLGLFGRKKAQDSAPGFGTFYGVYLPGILSMFGVIIYLRFGWIIGSLGLFTTIVIVSLACFIVFLTILSIASAATNMNVGGGGTYYMVSRSLGIEVGSAIGVPLFIAQTLSISFCAVGFAESIQPYFPTIPLNILGITALLAMLALVYTSSALALKAQFFIFLIIAGSLISLFLGAPLPLEAPETTAATTSLPFWAGFALFFPAATGFEAGVSMSGELKCSRKSLPLGTIAVLISGFLIYTLIPFFMSTHASQSSLITDPLVFQHIARYESLIIAGIWAAVLSSILSGLLAAPRTLQALASDGVLPKFLAKESGKSKNPRVATVLCLLIAVLGVYYGSIDKIAPVLTMFYLVTYATLNLATGLESLLGNPSWRPTFRVNWISSILGVALCLMAMFMIDAGSAFIALFFVSMIYTYMRSRKLAGNWEDIRHGVLMLVSRFAIHRLAKAKASPRSWRPNFLVLSDNPLQVSSLVNLTSSITRSKGFLTLASVFSPNLADLNRADRWKKLVSNYLQEKKIDALIEFSVDDSVFNGANKFLTSYGIGSITPNTLVLGETTKPELLQDFMQIIQAACRANKNVLIVRDKKTEHPIPKKVDIWWDDESKNNSELMLLFGHMLSFNKKYKKAAINLNGIAASEDGKEKRLKYFQEFFIKGRFSFNSTVYIGESSPQIQRSIMSQVSRDADIAFIGIVPPNLTGPMDGYLEYYKQLLYDTAGLPNAAFVIGSGYLNLREIFN